MRRINEPVTLAIDLATNNASYETRDTRVSGFFYHPDGNGPFPAILMLHSKRGPEQWRRSQAAWLANQGYVVFAPDYFTSMGITRKNFDILSFRRSINIVMEDLAHGLYALKSLPNVDSKRLGVMGFSLGGYLGFYLAARSDVKAVISYYGAYPKNPVSPDLKYDFPTVVTRIIAPILMLHGDMDEQVPIEWANLVQKLLNSNCKQFEYVVFPGVGHNFDAPIGPLANLRATKNAQQKVLAFLKTELR